MLIMLTKFIFILSNNEYSAYNYIQYALIFSYNYVATNSSLLSQLMKKISEAEQSDGSMMVIIKDCWLTAVT